MKINWEVIIPKSILRKLEIKKLNELLALPLENSIIRIDQLFLLDKEFLYLFQREKVTFWAILFLLSQCMKLIGYRGEQISSEACWDEMEEAVMNHYRQPHLQSLDEFFFDSWYQNKYDFDDKESWKVRLGMLYYHFKRMKN